MITWDRNDEMKVLIYNFPQQNDNKQSETNKKKFLQQQIKHLINYVKTENS